MSITRLAVSILLVGVLAGFAQAQDESERTPHNEFSVLAGRNFVSSRPIVGATFFNNKVNYGGAATFEFNYARRVYDRGFLALNLEVPFILSFDQDLGTGANLIPDAYKFFFVTPSARLHAFADTRVSPWVSFGGGFGHFSESSTLLYGGPNPGQAGTTTGVLQIGGGLDVRVYRAFGLRAEIRDLWSGMPQLNVNTGGTRQTNIFVSGGITYHF
jgi:hypothetical protein